MQFRYSARSLKGETSIGVMDADTLAAARQLMREKGLFALSLAPVSAGTVQIATPRRGFFKPRVKKAELMLVTSQLVIMCRAGLDLADAIKNLSVSCRNATLKDALHDIYKDVSDGLSFSGAMKKQSRLFGDGYVASVAAGEASGKLPDVLARLADMLRSEIQLQSTVTAALSYPIVLMGACALVVMGLLLFVLPNFEKVFIEMDLKPPLMTQVLLEFSGELRRRIWLWGAVTASIGVVAHRLLKTETTRRVLDGFFLRTALLGDVLQSLRSGRMFVMLGTMLQSGVPLIQGLQLCRSAMRSICYQELLDTLQTEVLNGRTISRVLNNARFIPPGAAQMVGTAEESGKLGTVMQMVGEYYELEGQRKIHEMAKLLEPLIIIVMGVIVAFVVASIMLPMLDISTMGGQ